MVSRRCLALALAVLGSLCLMLPTIPASQFKSARKGAVGGKTTGGGTGGSTSPGSSTSSSTSSSAADENRTESAPTANQLVIRRQRIHIRAPEKYQVSMQLEPIRSVRLAAPFDGMVKSLLHKSGDRVNSGTEVVRMDTTEKQLLLERAKALYKSAQAQADLATGGPVGSTGRRVADAQLEAAKAELDLAVYRVEQGSVRAPFDAEVFRVEVSEAQVLRMGDPLLTVGDTATLKAEIPVDRKVSSVGQTLQVKVEDQTVSAKIQAILPLAARFEALRDLLPSAASAVVLIENGDGRLKPGQTVFSSLVPRDPVAEVPNTCIGNAPDGTHKVQVLRDEVVRDVRIAPLAPVGADRSFISGAFDPTDELIVSVSQEVPDGTVVVRSAAAATPEAAKSASPAGAKPAPAEKTTKSKGL